jgi:hypothetical protein
MLQFKIHFNSNPQAAGVVREPAFAKLIKRTYAQLIRHSLLTFGIPLEMTFLCLFDSQIPTKT